MGAKKKELPANISLKKFIEYVKENIGEASDEVIAAWYKEKQGQKPATTESTSQQAQITDNK